MNIFKNLLLDTILMHFPIALYLIFLSTNKNIKNQKLFFIFAIITSVILALKYGKFANNFIIDATCIIFIISIIIIMYKEGIRILKVHLTYKELQQDKEIRLSLFKITHEIKNPIAVIKGYLDMINTKDKDQVERFIPIIRSEIDRLLILLEDFLALNRININSDIMDVNMLVEEQIHKFDSYIKEKNIKLKNNLLDDDVYISGDYNRLSQVVINIIKNSIEALEGINDGYIKITTRILDNNFNLIIEDNGIGMDKETLKKFMEPFFTTKARGTGLGVSLIYEIIQSHNGCVKYTSQLGKGTKVSITLPLDNEY